MNFVFDIDGTLSDHNPRAPFIMTVGKKKDWVSYYEHMGEDHPYLEAQRVISTLRARYGLLAMNFVTGRPEGTKEDPKRYRRITTEWLKKHFDIDVHEPTKPGQPYHYPGFPRLWMRGVGDYRPSVEYKEETVRLFFSSASSFLFFDDDVRNTEMYRRYGLYFRAPECFATML